MTHDELKAIEDRLSKTTPGPWHSSADAKPYDGRSPFSEVGASIKNCPCDEEADFEPRGALTVIVGGAQDEQGGAVGVLRNEDADFIAHARTDIAALIEEVRRLKGEMVE